MIEELMKHHKL